ncbi:DNA-binding MarR family transcriptional regulator [Sphingomonas vulcanisoli]|uniref:DNA-binding MarR family transcriptional regulator n=2 Tax=Sphingomonas vulcanisoli TaxID=1658060 RepID=A0ABX0TVS4_9SPHN|nr:DNA-binding MarR family transcriptional regulator [Sphingomonas vulcanisoli]
MNEAINALVRKGLLDRQGSTEHGRIILISVSSEGHALLRDCASAVDALEEAFLSSLYPSEQAALRNMLQRILSRESKAPSHSV